MLNSDPAISSAMAQASGLSRCARARRASADMATTRVGTTAWAAAGETWATTEGRPRMSPRRAERMVASRPDRGVGEAPARAVEDEDQVRRADRLGLGGQVGLGRRVDLVGPVEQQPPAALGQAAEEAGLDCLHPVGGQVLHHTPLLP